MKAQPSKKASREHGVEAKPPHTHTHTYNLFTLGQQHAAHHVTHARDQKLEEVFVRGLGQALPQDLVPRGLSTRGIGCGGMADGGLDHPLRVGKGLLGAK